MSKRSFAVVALSTVCLATILAAVPTNSLVGYYDPWLDYNDDGNIDMKDVAASARAFGSYGDPTKNVNVMNWPGREQMLVWWDDPVAPSSGLASPEYDSFGFSQLHILIFATGLTSGEWMELVVFGNMYNAEHTALYPIDVYRAILTDTSYSYGVTVPVPSQKFSFYVFTEGSSDGNIHLSFYLTWA